MVNLSENEKKQAVIELCAKEETASAIATKYGVERTSLYNWKKDLLGDKEIEPMPKKRTKPEVTTLQEEVTQLYKQADELKRQVYQLQLEKDVLEKAAEIIKKDQGIIFQTLTNREKAIVIDTLRDKYKLAELLSVFHMAKSSYCYQINAMNAPDKYETERELIDNHFLIRMVLMVIAEFILI